MFLLISYGWTSLITAYAAWRDIQTRTIPNALVLVGLLGLLIIQSGAQIWHPTSLFVGLMIGLILWQLKVIGGGDSKLLILVSATFEPTQLALLYLCISLAGAVQAIIALIFKQSTNLPYAVAIFTGTLAFLITKLTNT